jgi:SAM-dependent methyltransferase
LGVDISARAVEIAQQRAAAAGAGSDDTGRGPAVRFARLDAIEDSLPTGFDVILASLFLHHLDESQAVGMLGRMAAATRQLVLINDLVRSRGNLLLVALGARLLTTSGVVHKDAKLSVRAAFTVKELRRLAGDAGLHDATIRRSFPCRMLLIWRKT